MYDDAYTRNEDGELAVRTVSATEGSNTSSYDDVFTRTTDGKLALRVVGNGGGGGDQHNLGYFATPAALEEAYPTAEAGDWAIVGATDTVWLWDSDNSEWVDSDQKGQVTSVNGQTGDVTLAIPEAVQYDTMPTASADNLGDIVQFIGTTDANYTNGYFYKCTGAGDPAVYSWTRVDVQPTPSGLPDQTGQSGKFLTTDGTDASWSDKPLVNTATSTNSLTILGNANTTKKDSINIGYNSSVNNFGDIAIGVDSTANGGQEYGVALGYKASDTAPSGVALGARTKAQGFYTVAIGGNANASQYYSIALGYRAQATASGAIQLGFYNSSATTNSDANTFKVANENGNFEIMSADGTVPTARLTKVNTTATLAVADWSSNTQTVSVTGVAADSVVFVSPAPASASDYAGAGILCTAQAAGTLTFTCDTVPSNAITVNVVCL